MKCILILVLYSYCQEQNHFYFTNEQDIVKMFEKGTVFDQDLKIKDIFNKQSNKPLQDLRDYYKQQAVLAKKQIKIEKNFEQRLEEMNNSIDNQKIIEKETQQIIEKDQQENKQFFDQKLKKINIELEAQQF